MIFVPSLGFVLFFYFVLFFEIKKLYNSQLFEYTAECFFFKALVAALTINQFHTNIDIHQ